LVVDDTQLLEERLVQCCAHGGQWIPFFLFFLPGGLAIPKHVVIWGHHPKSHSKVKKNKQTHPQINTHTQTTHIDRPGLSEKMGHPKSSG
jgi:hypothetical protein